jgi:hypothetical protein
MKYVIASLLIFVSACSTTTSQPQLSQWEIANRQNTPGSWQQERWLKNCETYAKFEYQKRYCDAAAHMMVSHLTKLSAAVERIPKPISRDNLETLPAWKEMISYARNAEVWDQIGTYFPEATRLAEETKYCAATVGSGTRHEVCLVLSKIVNDYGNGRIDLENYKKQMIQLSGAVAAINENESRTRLWNSFAAGAAFGALLAPPASPTNCYVYNAHTPSPFVQCQ